MIKRTLLIIALGIGLFFLPYAVRNLWTIHKTWQDLESHGQGIVLAGPAGDALRGQWTSEITNLVAAVFVIVLSIVLFIKARSNDLASKK